MKVRVREIYNEQPYGIGVFPDGQEPAGRDKNGKADGKTEGYGKSDSRQSQM
jgi:hypothetical protein